MIFSICEFSSPSSNIKLSSLESINIFGYKTDITINDNTFFNDVTPDKNFTKQVDTDKIELGTISFSQNGGELKYVNIRQMKTDNNSTKLEDQWWFKWYFSILGEF